MTASHDDKHRDLTFSQREGKAPVIEPELGTLSVIFRNSIWQITSEFLDQCSAVFTSKNRFSLRAIDDAFGDFIYSYWINVLHLPHDDENMPYNDDGIVGWWREIILKKEYHILITLLEHLFRYNYPDSHYKTEWVRLKTLIKAEIDKHTLYFVDDSRQPTCIMPIVSKESKESLKNSVKILHDQNKTAAVDHLHSAAEKINNSQWSDAVRDSIHSVESVALTIEPKAQTLGEALRLLDRNGLIEHQALGEAFRKLYGYASDREGVRHATVFGEDTPVERDEAIFMYGACASFAAYLTIKQKRLEQEQK